MSPCLIYNDAGRKVRTYHMACQLSRLCTHSVTQSVRLCAGSVVHPDSDATNSQLHPMLYLRELCNLQVLGTWGKKDLFCELEAEVWHALHLCFAHHVIVNAEMVTDECRHRIGSNTHAIAHHTYYMRTYTHVHVCTGASVCACACACALCVCV